MQHRCRPKACLFKPRKYHRHPGLRNINGAIDRTHIQIVDTPGVQHHEVFRNRKSYFSVNVKVSKIKYITNSPRHVCLFVCSLKHNIC